MNHPMQSFSFKMRFLAIIVLASSFGSTALADNAVDFNRDIQPILADKCFACHGPDENTREAKLRLDTEEGATAEVILRGKPDESELIHRITAEDVDDVMPPPDANIEAVTPEEAALLRQWIADGAPWTQHWAFITPTLPEIPAVEISEGSNPIDAFIQARLVEEGLTLAPEADKVTLIRRATLDLIGLPPTLEEIEAYLADDSPDAYGKVIDRLLASPHYGERMAMDWLDGARYADTNGYQNDFNRFMWPWRDWVINAFNENMPFDQFTIEQIAGDMLPDATDSQRIATGFNRNNRAVTEGGAIEEEWQIENIVDRVETTSAVYLGLTMGCGRCQSHKYDPISQREFYQFFAFLNNTVDRGFYQEARGNTGPIVAIPGMAETEELGRFDKRVARAEKALKKLDDAKNEKRDEWLVSLLEATAPEEAANTSLHLALDGDTGTAQAGKELLWSEGLLGNSPTLTGTAESRVNAGEEFTFDRRKPFAVSLWVRPEGPGSLFSKMDDKDAFRGVDLLLSEDYRLAPHIIHQWPDNAIKTSTAPNTLQAGVWSHVVLSYDGSSKAEGTRVYVNGSLVTANVDNNNLSSTIFTEAPIWLGSRSDSAYLKGNLSDFRVYDAALTPKIIKGIFESTLAVQAGSESFKEDLLKIHDQVFLATRKQREDVVTKANAEREEYKRANIPTVMVMEELTEKRPTYLLTRGVYDQPDTSEALEPAVPAFLPGLPEGAPQNRLGLAQWLVAPENPLTSRVTVNRLWAKFFGQGLVTTIENFGVQSQPPSHPELLDWLALEFINQDWDLKSFQKTILMSHSYRQASVKTAASAEKDPMNTLLSRGPRFRLQAEVLRDNALAVSGLLVPVIGGPPVKPYQPDGLWTELAGGASLNEPYTRDTGENLYRRSMYIFRKRTVPPPQLTTFDAPSWELCTVARARTNTPLQALALLNDETYLEASRNLAQRMIDELDAPSSERLGHGFRLATGRYPSDTEQAILDAGFAEYLGVYRNDGEAAKAFLNHGESPVNENTDPALLSAYTAVASVILNLDETINKE